MKITVSIPLFGPTMVHPKTFKSIVEMLMEPIEGHEINVFINQLGPSLDLNRNDSVSRILEQNPDFIMWLDADMVFPKDAIKRLVASIGDAGACTGLYWRKANPHRCVIGRYAGWTNHTRNYMNQLKSLGFVDSHGEQCLFYEAIDNLEKVSEVDVFGMGCVLIRTDVFRSLKQPYFEYFNGYKTGDHSFGPISEEMAFCAAVHKQGIKVVADPGVKCGHISELVVFEPQKEKVCA